MMADGMNCVFTYMDLGSNIALVQALSAKGVWPPDKCTGPKCFSVVYGPYTVYDPRFISDAGEAAPANTSTGELVARVRRSLSILIQSRAAL